MALSPRQKLLILYGLRDQLFAFLLRRWRAEGWAIQPHVTPARGNHWASVDEEEHLVHLYPHDNPDQPPDKTLLHELVHVGLELFNGGSKRDEDTVRRLEELLWPILRPEQKRALRNLLGPSQPMG